MEVQGKGEADWGSQVAEGLLGDRVAEWEEACLALAQQRMEEVDAVPAGSNIYERLSENND